MRAGERRPVRIKVTSLYIMFIQSYWNKIKPLLVMKSTCTEPETALVQMTQQREGEMGPRRFGHLQWVAE